jgi:uncharacterized protein YyaL (SSP411 family)
LLAEPRFIVAAERVLALGAAALTEQPAQHCTLLTALSDHLDPPKVVILRGNLPELAQWQAAGQAGYVPKRRIFVIPNDAVLPESLAGKAAGAGVQAYVCQGLRCLPAQACVGDPLAFWQAT